MFFQMKTDENPANEVAKEKDSTQEMVSGLVVEVFFFFSKNSFPNSF